jgi:exodeoxyribonuclease VII large subunit
MRAISSQVRADFELAAGRLNALSPLNVLDRGYAICRDGSGKILRDSAHVSAGDDVQIALARGELQCRVEKTTQSVE